MLSILAGATAASLLSKALQWEVGDGDAAGVNEGHLSPSTVERGISSLICSALEMGAA